MSTQNFFPLVQQERKKLDRKLGGQDTRGRSNHFVPLTVVGTILGLGALLLHQPPANKILADHPMCGLTTGGQGLCYDDCQITKPTKKDRWVPVGLISNIECLLDCFNGEETPHCVKSLLTDLIKNGICYTDNPYDDCYNATDPTACPALLEGIFPINYNHSCVNMWNGFALPSCSAETEKLLFDIDCWKDIEQQQEFIYYTLVYLIGFSCSDIVYTQFRSFPHHLCYSDCEIAPLFGVVSDVECLQDCFQNKTLNSEGKSVHCVEAVISDALNSGICYQENQIPGQCSDSETGICPAAYEGVYPINYGLKCDDLWSGNASPTCSPETQNLLRDEDCIRDIENFYYENGRYMPYLERSLSTLKEYSCPLAQDDCYQDCKSVYYLRTSIVTNIECLMDCFVNKTVTNGQESVHCYQALISDVLENGICNRPDIYSGQCNNATSCPSRFEGIFPINYDLRCDDLWDVYYNDIGSPTYYYNGNGSPTCSNETESLLLGEECRDVDFELDIIRNTLKIVTEHSCSPYVHDEVFGHSPSTFQRRSGTRNLESQNKDSEYHQTSNQSYRLPPIERVTNYPNFTLKTDIRFPDTRNRYPWVCSLRRRGPTPEHLCAVTLLSVPPQPTILVVPAHCTYLCKDKEENHVPSCCCIPGAANCADDLNKCGEEPGVYEMKRGDAWVVCGEWDTQDIPWVTSGERYNVYLNIIEIVRHPDFNTKTGPLQGNDIAILKVEDSSIKDKISSLQLWPICLPSADKKKEGNITGIHTGWSKPPPRSFIMSQVPPYLPFYQDFYKQWHYSMEIVQCRDSVVTENNRPIKFPSNTSYPPGTVCAKDVFRKSCFSTGESGSPLMLTEKTRPNRYYAEGVLSFVKGCQDFRVYFKNRIDKTENRTFLWQYTDNPSVYTKLSCFLPWIAGQYGLTYETDKDTACHVGQGDPLDKDKENCNTTLLSDVGKDFPMYYREPCIFPFYFNGKFYNECIVADVYGFTQVVYRCPVFNSTSKIDGINSYTSVAFVSGYCLDKDSYDSCRELPMYLSDICIKNKVPVNPDQNWCDDAARHHTDPRISGFGQCKNNCPGVVPYGIIGGGATLAGIAATSFLSSVVPQAAFGLAGLGMAGVAGVGGSMFLQSSCAGPFFCRAVSGRCCLVVFSSSGLVCPDTC